MTSKGNQNLLKRALDDLRQHPSADWLLAQLWRKESPVRKFLMNPRDVLFPTIPDIVGEPIGGLNNVPIKFLFCIGSIPDLGIDQPADGDPPDEVVAESDGGEFGDQERLMTMMAHGLIQIARANPSIKKLINDDEYSLVKMERETRGFQEVKADILTEDFNEIDPMKILLPTKEDSKEVYEIKKMIRGMIKDFLADESNMIRGMLNLSLAYLQGVYIGAALATPNFLERSNMSLKDYQKAILDLQDYRFLEHYGWGWVCSDCSPMQGLTPSLTSSFRPPWTDIDCPNCSQVMNWVLMVKIGTHLEKAILYRDGIMALALGSKLEELGVPYESGIHFEKGECDLRFDLNGESIVTELKMVQFPNKRKGISKFRPGVRQLMKIPRSGTQRFIVVHNSYCRTPEVEGIQVVNYLLLFDHLRVNHGR